MSLFNFAAIIAVTALSGSALSYEQAKALADQDENSLTPGQTQQLIASQGKAGGEAHASCASPSNKADLSPYTVVMELDIAGKVIRTWLKGASPLAVCFNKEMATKRLFGPPRAPFYTSFEMTWRP
ncbi:hypothetical protein [Rudaea cellulosilytica]|uniref:hypothetical protein n=1 Tax=Rudaea cellulosilytica TaxID=540746 RepID=UPI0009FFAF07|nr:hypothetical protein [Rudaea cellulosilytica]